MTVRSRTLSRQILIQNFIWETILLVLMAAIPASMFTASKVHQDLLDQGEGGKCTFVELNLPHYSSKLMNSIWGRYNRYAPPAFQKNNEPWNGANQGAPSTQIRSGMKYDVPFLGARGHLH